jgi:hypothetical protein
MLVVRVELWPNGRGEHRREIGRATIWNETQLADVSDYGYTLRENPSDVTESLVSTGGLLTGFPRRKLGVFDLMYRILKQELGVRNSPLEDDDADAV